MWGHTQQPKHKIFSQSKRRMVWVNRNSLQQEWRVFQPFFEFLQRWKIVRRHVIHAKVLTDSLIFHVLSLVSYQFYLFVQRERQSNRESLWFHDWYLSMKEENMRVWLVVYLLVNHIILSSLSSSRDRDYVHQGQLYSVRLTNIVHCFCFSWLHLFLFHGDMIAIAPTRQWAQV